MVLGLQIPLIMCLSMIMIMILIMNHDTLIVQKPHDMRWGKGAIYYSISDARGHEMVVMIIILKAAENKGGLINH